MDIETKALMAACFLRFKIDELQALKRRKKHKHDAEYLHLCEAIRVAKAGLDCYSVEGFDNSDIAYVYKGFGIKSLQSTQSRQLVIHRG